MVNHGALSKSHVHQMLASKDARVRRAAYTLLEASNPTLRRNSELFLEIIRFIWEANPSYDVYREFNKRHLIVPYKVHELISARLKLEKQEQQRAAASQRAGRTPAALGPWSWRGRAARARLAADQRALPRPPHQERPARLGRLGRRAALRG